MQYNSNTLSQMNLKNIILSSALALLFIFNSSNALALDFTLLTDIHVTPGNENEKQLIAPIYYSRQPRKQLVAKRHKNIQ